MQAPPWPSLTMSSSSLLAAALARLDAGCLGCVGTLRFALASRLAASDCRAEQTFSSMPYAPCSMHLQGMASLCILLTD